VWENVVLGAEPTGRAWVVKRERAVRSLRELADRYHLDIDPERYAGELSAEGMQTTALLSALYHDVRLVILDEPTSAAGDDTATPAALIERLVEKGKTVVLITHKLRDALSTADRITVMRAGRAVTTAPAEELSLQRLSSLMIGESQVLRQASEREPVQAQERHEAVSSVHREVLAMEGVSCNEPGFPPLRHLDLSVISGEVTAVTGIRENGLETLEHILAGLTTPDRGTVRYLGEEMRSFSSSELRKREIAYIPTERLVRGASMESSVEENMILLNYRDFHSWGRLKKDEIEHYTGRLRKEYGIKGSLKQTLSGLSGGNIQKVIISRELERLPRLVIFSEPSWGLDTTSREFVFEKIELLARRGSAVLILTSDLDEALEGADTIVPLYRGRSVGRVSRAEVTKARLGRMILGVEGEEGER
jgi:simple sugar transport system ATP-binding protein